MISLIRNRFKRRNNDLEFFTFPCPQDGCTCKADVKIFRDDIPAERVEQVLRAYADAVVLELTHHIRRDHGKHVNDCPRAVTENDYCVCAG